MPKKDRGKKKKSELDEEDGDSKLEERMAGLEMDESDEKPKKKKEKVKRELYIIPICFSSCLHYHSDMSK